MKMNERTIRLRVLMNDCDRVSVSLSVSVMSVSVSVRKSCDQRTKTCSNARPA